MIPNIQRLLFLFSIVLLLVVQPVYAQNELIIQKKISVSSELAGHVDIQMTGARAIGVKVELYSSDWKTVLASTTTDGNGRFSLAKTPGNKLFYVQVSSPGMNPYRLRVRIRKNAVHDLTIHLSVAS
jgi:Carboxypeptidase regulatory-like domain